jgi:hypothetical protein
MPGDVTPYTSLITSEYAASPNYMAMVAQTCQPFADIISMYRGAPFRYDVDTAIGTQLDVVGQWVGVDRRVEVPIVDVYFSFDIAGVGFDEGIWWTIGSPEYSVVMLPDDYYRSVIKARILNNHWNGSKEDAYALSDEIFGPLGMTLLIEDHSDLSMSLGLLGTAQPTPLSIALLISGKFDIKPAGVAIRDYFYPYAPGPIFGLGQSKDTNVLAGLGIGYWVQYIVTPTNRV